MNFDISKAMTKEEALSALLREWKYTVKTEHVRLEDCVGRVAAEDIVSVNQIPMMRISAMDGFAVKSENFADGIPDVSVWKIHEEFEPADTGDDFPDDYDTIIPVEQLHYDENRRLVLEDGFTFTKGSNIRPEGCMMQVGDLLVPKNTKITPELQANLAIGGIVRVPVVKRPVVAFIPTGSELVPAGQKPERGQNVDCNTFLMSSYLKKWGAEPDCFPIAKDSTVQLEWAMDDALKTADIVILNGGSSKGSEDYNSRLLERRGNFFLHTVKTVPGRPVGIAMIDGKPVINVPGPTMAAWVVADWLIQPMICGFLGIPVIKRKQVEAILTDDLRKGPPVELYTKVHVEKKDGKYYATPLGRGARNSQVLREGNAVYIGAVGSTGAAKGDVITVELLVEEEWI